MVHSILETFFSLSLLPSPNHFSLRHVLVEVWEIFNNASFTSFFLHSPLKPIFPKSNLQSRKRDANRNAQRAAILSWHMESVFKEKEASFLNPCPQRPLLWYLHPLLFPYLLYPSHQDPSSPTIPSGLSLLSTSFCHHFKHAHVFFFFGSFGFNFVGFLFLFFLCSLRSRCLWVLRWGNRWSSMILMGLSMSPHSTQITVLVGVLLFWLWLRLYCILFVNGLCAHLGFVEIIELCLIVGCFISSMIGLCEFDLILLVLNCG